MSWLTTIALRRPSVAILAIILVLLGGTLSYRSLQVELFPQIEFPLVTVAASYPSADPEAVARDIAIPIERAIAGADGLERVQTTAIEGNAVVLATFRYGTDMTAAENNIRNALNSVTFPSGAGEPTIGRFNTDAFPVIQFGVVSERPLAEIQKIVENIIVPEIENIPGALSVSSAGGTGREANIIADIERLAAEGVSFQQVARALRENNVTLPAGLLFDGSQAVIAKTTHTFSSLEELRVLVVGANKSGPVLLEDVATISFGETRPSGIARVNGEPGLIFNVTKEPEANTLDVTRAVNDVLAAASIPDDLSIIVVTDQGPDIQGQIDALTREAGFGFLFAVSVVFAFMLTIRPTLFRGLFTTVRPTLVIALSIPLSVSVAILLMFWQEMTLNFMTLGGLAISVGRVVDDSIVVLENVYRHIQGGRERWRAALEGSAEVGPAILASTLTTVVVFLPLAFIQGLVGAFFLPFALTVTFALLASLAVALTAVPVLGALLLRAGDLPEGAGDEGEIIMRETWLQRIYLSALRWALGHRAITLAAAALLTFGSLGLLAVIPVSLFGGDGDRFLEIQVDLPPGSGAQQTAVAVTEMEARIEEVSDVYSASIGVGAGDFTFSSAFGSEQAVIFARLKDDAPEGIAETLRAEFERPGRIVRVREISDGPPTGGVEIVVTGPDYSDISAVTRELAASIAEAEGVVNLESNVTQARSTLSVQVDPVRAASIGLTTRQVGLQLSQFLIGQRVTSITVDGESVDVTLSGYPVGNVEQLRSLLIMGPGGAAFLGDIADPVLRDGEVTISRTDGQRSATITADIVADDIQVVQRDVDARIAALSLPPGVAVVSGGIFADVEEGFQAIFVSLAVGVALVYLVMVASLGSLRNPFVILLTLPLALVGVLTALAITDRALGLAAMMGILLTIGIVVTNAIVLVAFVEQQRARGLSVREALLSGARVRLRPILMTAATTSFALLPLAVEAEGSGGIISAELATVVIGGLTSSTALTLLVLPIVYLLFNESIPKLLGRMLRRSPAGSSARQAPAPARAPQTSPPGDVRVPGQSAAAPNVLLAQERDAPERPGRGG